MKLITFSEALSLKHIH